MKYRGEIDGLRALAVLPVFFYHAGVKGFSGGFIGVDVFFVISGYLITSLIVSEMETGEFSIANFYERRARRILPALSVVLIACIFITWFVLLPFDLKHFSESLVATTLFLSNFYFKNRTGYFFPEEAETSPILHTWSLAIEEQFYIFFPLLLILSYRFVPKQVRQVIIVIGAISLFTSIWWVKVDQEEAFYLLPFRAWELFLGSILARQFFTGKSFTGSANKIFNELAGIAGIVTLILCVVFYDRNMEFPGLSAVLPCFATFLIILSNSNQLNSTGKFLSLKPVVFMGLISYSFYLWHWPLIVVLKYYQDTALSWLQVALILITTLILSILTWHFVENPVRRKKILVQRKQLVRSAVGVFVLLAAVGLTIMYFQGFPQRMDPAVIRFASAKEDFDRETIECFRGHNLELIKKDQLCNFGDKTKSTIDFILWGDSHADAIYPAIKSLAEKYRMHGVFAANAACPPLSGVSRVDKDKYCRNFNNSVLDYIQSKQIKNIIMAARWDVNILGRTDYELSKGEKQIYLQDAKSRSFSIDESIRVFKRGIHRTLRQLLENESSIWVILQAPDVGLRTPHYLARMALSEKLPEQIRIDLADNMTRHNTVKQLFMHIKNYPQITLVDPADQLCSDSQCLIGFGGYSLYKDDDHLSRFGALHIQDTFMPVFKKMTGNTDF